MINYTIICQSKHWPARFKKVENLIKKVLLFKKDLFFKFESDYICNIILTDNDRIKKMNYKFRKKNKITDVLTFVSELNFKKTKKIKVTDIFLAAEMIKNDASKNYITFYDHLTHLFIHSMLHVNGFTHKKTKDFIKMQNVEIKILKKLKITNPYLQD